MGRRMAENVNKKNWGYELLWACQEFYCGKILVFEKAGNKCSMHFHKERDKSYFVNNGKFILRIIDTSTGSLIENEIQEGDTFDINRLTPHQLEAVIEGSSVTEVSNYYDSNDIFRLIPSSSN